jgi:hypothetical protein
MSTADPTAAATAFALAAVLHLGFQATVTVLVYPALVRVGLDHPEDWSAAHDRHSRAIVPLVGIVYVALLAAGVWLLLSGPGPLELLSLAGAWGAVAVTGAVAAPTHGRLARPEPPLLRRLMVADRARTALALVGALAGVATHVWG